MMIARMELLDMGLHSEGCGGEEQLVRKLDWKGVVKDGWQISS